MMKIYFAGSITGGRGDSGLYQEIITLLKDRATILTEHIGSSTLSSYGETNLSSQAIYERDCGWIRESDAIVAEVTQTSLGVGYELGLAEALGKKIICLYRPDPSRRLSAMLTGNKNFIIIEYQTVEELRPKLLAAL
jgi:nucleoside 2-deoxyribosyltransferase